MLLIKKINRCHFVSFVMKISGDKFEEHCFNISIDILYSVFYHCSCEPHDVITSLISVIQKRHWSLKREKIFQKNKMLISEPTAKSNVKRTRMFVLSIATLHYVTSADYFDNVMAKFIVYSRTDAWKTENHLFFKITNCQIVRSRSLLRRINYKFMCLSAYWR